MVVATLEMLAEVEKPRHLYARSPRVGSVLESAEPVRWFVRVAVGAEVTWFGGWSREPGCFRQGTRISQELRWLALTAPLATEVVDALFSFPKGKAVG